MVTGELIVALSRPTIDSASFPIRCNSSSNFSDSVCSESISFNVFDNLRRADFADIAPFEDKDGRGSLAGSCNFQLTQGSLSNMTFPGEGEASQCQSQLNLTVQQLVSLSEEFGQLPVAIAS